MLKTILLVVIFVISFSVFAEEDNKYKVTESINISDKTVKFKCKLNVSLDELPDWVEKCTELTLAMMLSSVEKGVLVLQKLPTDPYG